MMDGALDTTSLKCHTHSACSSFLPSFFSSSSFFFFCFPFGEFLLPEPLKPFHEIMAGIQISESILPRAIIVVIMTLSVDTSPRTARTREKCYRIESQSFLSQSTTYPNSCFAFF